MIEVSSTFLLAMTQVQKATSYNTQENNKVVVSRDVESYEEAEWNWKGEEGQE